MNKGPIPLLKFTLEEAQAASDAWQFNCGPGAVCAILEKKPEEIRPFLGDFEKKGYISPKMMPDILKRLSVPFCYTNGWPVYGLARVQWAGPWTLPGVPHAARYKHTHWIAVVSTGDWFNSVSKQVTMNIFDINATCVGGWISFEEWAGQLVPWLLKRCEPQATGKWWLTHRIEIEI